MRLSAVFLRLVVFAAAAAVSLVAAQKTVEQVEERSVIGVQQTLVNQGYDWASVLGDGLQVIIEGEAPTEAARFRAISAAGGIVDASRVIDNMSVIDSAQIAPPSFTIEILRNDSGVSLIGLIPSTTDRAALAARIAEIADGDPVTDLLETADHPAPGNWRVALNYGLRALDLLSKSKISVNAERVIIDAIADNPDEKRRLETALARNTPDGVRLAVDIRAPRPVISPYLTRFTVDEDGARFEACAVDTEESLALILEAASAAGFQERANCVFALGSPSVTWGEAVAAGIRAVRQFGGGTVTVSDTDLTIVAPEGTDQQAFDLIVGRLQNSLPEAFAMRAELPSAQQDTTAQIINFTATRNEEGAVQIRGRVPDDLTNTVVENFAQAKFGQRNVTMGTRLTEGLPGGWSVRILAGVEALSALSDGTVSVTPTSFRVTGNTGNPDASAELSSLLLDKLGQTADFDIDVTYVEALDPIASLPTPESCLEQIKAITDETKILFDPGSDQLTAATQPVVDQIADILRGCGDLPIRVSGYTDSQGREEMNQQLSQGRADAVLTALRARRVPVSTFEAIGFGEENPIADNDTPEGREANRRIEFSLIPPAGEEEATEGEETDGEATEQATDGEAAEDSSDTSESDAPPQEAETQDAPAGDAEETPAASE